MTENIECILINILSTLDCVLMPLSINFIKGVNVCAEHI